MKAHRGTLFPRAAHLDFCFYWFKTVSWLFVVWLSNYFTGTLIRLCTEVTDLATMTTVQELNCKDIT